VSVARWAPGLPIQELLRSLGDELMSTLVRLWDPARSKEQRKLQKATMQALRRHCCRPFDAASPETDQMLCDIWNAAFPGQRIKAADDGEHWKLLGFQSAKPCTDVRAGRHALDQLHYLAQQYPELLQRLVEESREAGYPLACACFNVSQLIANFFQLQEGPCVSPVGSVAKAKAAQRQRFADFCGLSPKGPVHAMDEIFCALVERLHRTWMDMRLQEARLNLMGFNRALQEVHAAHAKFWRRDRMGLGELRALAIPRKRAAGAGPEQAGPAGFLAYVQNIFSGPSGRLSKRAKKDPLIFGSGVKSTRLGRSTS